jgi:menaquinol-cytochrome c reductase iron-sulfur subunit
MGDPASEAQKQTTPSRRGFFQWLTYALGAAAGVVVGVPFVGFLFGTPKTKPKWHKLGPIKGFRRGETLLKTFPNPLQQPWDGITAETGVYVRYEGADEQSGKHDFLILAVNCAHLGCPVSWFPQSGLFMCPCHGGVYYANGQRASGPPPRGLFRCNWEIRGQDLWVQAPHYPTLQDPLVPSDNETHG